MSASTTPTDRPRAARAAARFTVTEDLPTPPLPLATAYTRVLEPGWANGMTGSAAPGPRRLACSSLRCSGLITPKSISTPATAGTALTAAVMSARSLSRIGQPATVSRMPSSATPSRPTDTLGGAAVRVPVRFVVRSAGVLAVGLAGRPLALLAVLLAFQLGPPVGGLVQLLDQLAQLGADEVAGGHLAERDAQRGDLAGQVF